MPQRTAAPPRPAADPVSPPPRVDRRELRRLAADRRRALAAELRRPRPRRLRRLPVVVAGAVGLLLVVPPVLAVTPLLSVRRVEVSGGTPAVAAAVQQALAGQRGRPLAAVEDDEVRAALRGVAAVASSSVVRRPPSTLEVRVVLRTPVAQQRAASGWQQLDADRVVVAQSAARFPDLPVVSVAGGAAAPRAYATAVAALDAVEAHGLRVVRVTAAGPDDVVLQLIDGPRVQWGGAEQGAAKAEALTAALRGAATGAAEVDVSSPGVVLTR